jgi:hypothetical protein
MEKHQTNKEVEQDTSKALKQKTNQDFNGKKPSASDPNLNADKDDEEKPETETPGIGDDQPTDSEKITMGTKEKKEQPYKPEAPVEDEPITKKPAEVIGDDDAPAIVNERGSQVVNK